MSNETEVKQAVSDWLESFGCKIWWERKNKVYDYPVFKAKRGRAGTTEKPDILILTNGKYSMCETKNAEHKKNVYDALFQTLRYATNGDMEYFINGSTEPILISGYMVATQHSINGRLFQSDHEKLNESMSESRLYAINVLQELPQREYLMTEQFTRIIWRGAKKFNCEYKVGTLLSNVLNMEYPTPLFLYKQGKQPGYDVWR